jgi:hypothetical protein
MEINLDQFARYFRSNVIPSARVRLEPIGGNYVGRWGVSTYSPGSVDPLQVSGGFNSVVELAAVVCRRQAIRAMHPVPLDRSISVVALGTLLSAAPAGGRLSQVPAATALLTGQDYRGFRLDLALVGLTFADASTVTLTFSAALSFVFQAVSLPKVPTGAVDTHWDPSRVMESLGAALVSTPAPASSQALPRIVSEGRGDAGPTGRRRRPVATYGNPILPDESQLQNILVGSFTAELRAPLIHRDEPNRCTTRVFADLRRAQWSETLPAQPAAGQPANEVLLVHDACFSGWLADVARILQAPLDLPLSPTLSLVGPNAGGAPVPEITDFGVHASAVFDPSGFEPALAVAFDVMPGCHGILEDVRHFIGPNPYGVISDEFVVDSVFRHRWNRGGFDRRFELQAPIQVMVSRNGKQQMEDAVAFGHQDLLTLDHASIVTNSNLRADCIAFGGQARIVATSVRLDADGSTFDAGQVDLGPADPIPWSVQSIVDPTAAWSTDPQLREFQIEATRDGGQPIAAPFAWITSSNAPAITYARIEGISKYVLFLGSLPDALD